MTLIWLTGYSGSGKSTIALSLQTHLEAPILDGDVVRKELNAGHIHGIEGQNRNLEAIITLAKERLQQGSYVAAAFVSPKKELRAEVQERIESAGFRFIEVYVQAPIATCRERDVKGLYQQLDEGGNIQLAGVNVSYDAPKNPHITCNTDQETIDESVQKILQLLSH